MLVLLVALCLSLFFNFVALISAGGKVRTTHKEKEFDEEVVQAADESADGDGKIAVISLRGVISAAEDGAVGETMVDDIKLQLQQALEDEDVKAIVFYVDSPGGEVTASDNIYTALRAAREKKPVVVFMGSLAASGGYYAACGGTHLMANETTLTGSIGVIMQSLNYQQLFGKVGLEMNTFKSGKFKDMLSGSRQLSEEEKAYVQGMIMETYEKFLGIVATERKKDANELRNGVADGRVLSGKAALEAGLIDAVGSVEQAYTKAMELGEAQGAKVIRYEASFPLAKVLKMFGQSERASVEARVVKALTPTLEPGRLYFLSPLHAP